MSDLQAVASTHPISTAMAPLGVVIVTYNSAEVLPGLLDSLPAGLAGIETCEVVVVDNDSHDNSVATARAHPACTRVIETGRNAGYAAGINAATATFETGAHVLVLNPDIRLHPGTARKLYDRLSDPTVGVVVPQIVDEEGMVSLSLRREPSIMTVWTDTLFGTDIAARMGTGEIVNDPKLYADGGSAEWATGAILMIAAHARRAIGDWDESFFLYSEEVDYLERVRRRGMSVIYVPAAVAMHIGGEYHDNPRLSALMTKNRIRYFRRHHGAVPTFLFRLGIITGGLMRFALGAGQRAALWAALTR